MFKEITSMRMSIQIEGEHILGASRASNVRPRLLNWNGGIVMVFSQEAREELVNELTMNDQYDAFVAASLRRADGPVLRDVLAAELQHKGITFDHAGRIVRAAIERLQEAGVAIVTDPKGGFLITEDPAKVRAEAERFRTLLAAHARRARALDRIASRLERENINGGQRELFGEGR